MDKEYDFLIVGAGLFGAVFAHEATKQGKKCLVLDKRNHTGGNVHCKQIEGITVHEYGPHIFHTNNKKIWNYVNALVPFQPFINTPIVNYKGRMFNLPFNMNTFTQLWGVITPNEAKRKIARQVAEINIKEPKNLEEQALSLVGKDIYEIFIKGYTEKQWGRKAVNLPPFIIKRIPLRFTFNNNYFNDKYRGIPRGGYNVLINALLNMISVLLNVDYLQNRQELNDKAEWVVYSGQVDAFYGFRFGKLDYRSLHFDHKVIHTNNYQGNAVINYTESQIPYTRTIEHQFFDRMNIKNKGKTVVTWEYPQEYNGKNEPFYPINNEKNMKMYKEYKYLADNEPKVLFGGRLAKYRYYDMHQVIGSTLKMVRGILAENLCC